MSDKWFRDLEKGRLPRKADRKVMEDLAEALLLEPDQRLTLFLHTLGCPAPKGVTALHDSPQHRALQLVISQQAPRPAYLSDASWEIIAYNQVMADWFPWVKEPGANLLRWALLDPAARRQLVSWRSHARVYLAMLRLQLSRYRDLPRLMQLRDDVLRDPACLAIWEEDAKVVANRDGHHFRLRLPYFDGAEVDLISQVLIPAQLEDLRLVLLTWPGDDCFHGEFLSPEYVTRSAKELKS
ncbi:XRE family transcriptional regulator [Streptomyces sp. BI20]|uniref:MmyB family transcriptional regulator n=1 Tax=Streptomyces sp. BI20 TaxID=3403460 RepID=UPI003C7362E8